MVWITGLLISCLVLSADFAASQPVSDVTFHVLLGFCFLLMAPALAVLQSSVTTRRWADLEIKEAQARVLHRSLLGSNLLVWLCGCVGVLAVARWPQLLRQNWQWDRIPLLDEMALAIPMIGSVLLSWLVIYDGEKSLRVHDGEVDEQRRGIAFERLRTLTGLMLAPLALLFLSRDFFSLLFPDGLAPSSMFVVAMTFLLGLLVVYPVLLSRTWRTHDLPHSGLRRKLERVALEAGFPREKVCVWNTQSTVMNALMVGTFPGSRRVFLSDRLLECFDEDEVVAIYRHEIGHLIHHHQSMRLALMLVPILGLMAIAMVFVPSSGLLCFSNTAQAVGLLLATGVLSMVYYGQVVARFNRKSEIQADIFALVNPAGSICIRRADAYSRALLKMAAHAPELYDRTTSVHPSIQSRLEVIRQLIRDQSKIRQFHRQFHNDQMVAAFCLLAWVVFAVLLSRLL
ncbi:MAG: M48 family metalloprotease [Pirellulaceae bacterium]|nr:M48 family metalloprotease [Pirellulaceae bacterium]